MFMSRTARIPCFVKASTVGLLAISSRAIATVSSRSLFAGTVSVAMPISAALRPSMVRPVMA